MHGTVGAWLDLGAGPTTLLWALAFPGATSIAANDIDPEALVVLAQRTAAGVVPTCYRDAARLLNRPALAIVQAAALLQELLPFDVFRPWPGELSQRRFDLVTAMGTFGLADGPETYGDPFAHLRPHMRPNGVVLGANWIRSAAMVARVGRGNSWLSTDIVARAAEAAQLKMIFVERVPIYGDADYDAVIVWGMRP